MLILKMILRITGLSNEKISKFLGVSLVTFESWLKGEEISKDYVDLICKKINIPNRFFDIGLDRSISEYKEIFLIISVSCQNIDFDAIGTKEIDSIIEEVSSVHLNNETYENEDEYDDIDIVDLLIEGFDPFTGEQFPNNHILNNEKIKDILLELKRRGLKKRKVSLKPEELDEYHYGLYEILRKWRNSRAEKEGYLSFYYVFNNATLINIVASKIKKKEDLKNISGIGEVKYNKYSDEIYNIVNNYKLSHSKDMNYYHFSSETNDNTTIEIGDTVTCFFVGENTISSYKIIPTYIDYKITKFNMYEESEYKEIIKSDANIMKNEISANSPLAISLLGGKVGQKVLVYLKELDNSYYVIIKDIQKAKEEV